MERVAIRSGLAEGNNRRTLQARPRRIELSFSDGTCVPYQLANSPGEQRIRVKATGVDQVRLTIIDVYPPEDGGAPCRRAERGAVRKPGMHRAGVQRLQSSVGNRAVAQLVGGGRRSRGADARPTGAIASEVFWCLAHLGIVRWHQGRGHRAGRCLLPSAVSTGRPARPAEVIGDHSARFAPWRHRRPLGRIGMTGGAGCG
ncbi:hypothetical protein ACQP2Y_12860 [Actinoplanes sp. CA-051413]|uniref:hypothetical protein n=1 Tax=Actinoplanes sp. CA-051413 TaxID=3239899 RepID=UPI003D97211E